jgi:hypothetical protein
MLTFFALFVAVLQSFIRGLQQRKKNPRFLKQGRLMLEFFRQLGEWIDCAAVNKDLPKPAV